MPRSRSTIFWPVVSALVVADVITKRWAEATLMPERMPNPVFGEWLRWTLVYNPGAAFGLNVGPASRWVFLVLTIIALVILWRLYRQTDDGDTPRVLALSLVCAGAIGNLVDRVRHERGVVDFIDMGVGGMRWPTFNVADMAVTSGAFLLAWVLWHEEEPPAVTASATDGIAADRGEAA
jgi:signal peptidase II